MTPFNPSSLPSHLISSFRSCLVGNSSTLSSIHLSPEAFGNEVRDIVLPPSLQREVCLLPVRVHELCCDRISPPLISGDATDVIQDDDPLFRCIELFAGMGGFRVAAEALGGRSVFASELNPIVLTSRSCSPP